MKRILMDVELLSLVICREDQHTVILILLFDTSFYFPALESKALD